MNMLTKLKHWQLFLLLTFLFLFLYVGLPLLQDSDISSFKLLLAITPVFTAIKLAWCYAVAKALQNHLSPQLRDLMGWFEKTNKFSMYVYLLFGLKNIAEVLLISLPSVPTFISFVWALALLFAMYSLCYCIWFTARAIKEVENNRKYDSTPLSHLKPKPVVIWEFVLIWFFYIGIWFLQPRFQKLLSGR